MKEEILRLKKERDAVILAHNYQIPEVQEVADFIGDSLDLSRKAQSVPQKVIVFCGVKFMAESAKILSPDKTVLIPSLEANCPMADMVTGGALKREAEKYEDIEKVCYVNTNAETKAECDVCCTSANAVDIVKQVKSKRVLFAPDRNLAHWVSLHTDKEVIPWDGYCYVHEQFTKQEVEEMREKYPDAVIIVHPECKPEVVALADEVLSTNGMVRFIKSSEKREFVIGTEYGLIQRLTREFPDKKFYSLGEPKYCMGMKSITLEDVYNSLKFMRYKIEIPDDILKRARAALDKMVKT